MYRFRIFIVITKKIMNNLNLKWVGLKIFILSSPRGKFQSTPLNFYMNYTHTHTQTHTIKDKRKYKYKLVAVNGVRVLEFCKKKKMVASGKWRRVVRWVGTPLTVLFTVRCFEECICVFFRQYTQYIYLGIFAHVCLRTENRTPAAAIV